MGKKSYIFSHTESYLLTLHLTTNVMRQRYNKIFILLLLVLAAPNAFAQQIKGVVTDSVTHEPLMYISIYYQEKRDMGTITNIDGEYNLDARRNGGTLVFSAVGYISKTVKVHYANQTVNVQLAPDNVLLNEIVVKPKLSLIHISEPTRRTQ